MSSTLVEESWSFNQKALLTIVFRVSASFSILGSSYIIWHNLKSDSERRERLRNVYNRLLLVLSICELLVSSSFFISTWAIPKDDPQSFYVYNFGNRFTCNLQGFLAHIGGLAVPLYNACLSIYFLLCTRYRIPNERIKERIEPIFHLVSLGIPFATALYGVLGKLSHLW